MDSELYAQGAGLTAVITFVITWLWCIAEYGFLLGVGLGWLPSAIVAAIAGFLWPLIALAIVALILLIVLI